MISPSQRPLSDNTQHSQQTDIHAPGGIRTRNLRKRAATDPRLRPLGHCEGLCKQILQDFLIHCIMQFITAHRCCYLKAEVLDVTKHKYDRTETFFALSFISGRNIAQVRQDESILLPSGSSSGRNITRIRPNESILLS